MSNPSNIQLSDSFNILVYFYWANEGFDEVYLFINSSLLLEMKNEN